MEVKIIINKQTPKLKLVKNPETWGKENKTLTDVYIKFLTDRDRNPYGLAANQASVDGKRCMERFFVTRDLKTSDWSIIINPVMFEQIGITDNVLEGCLTWDTGNVSAKRYRRIKVSYYTADGEFKEELITGFKSHIWQHEINHLDGVPEEIVDVDVQTVSNPKIERNEQCPCGTGKKYKKCCEPFSDIIKEE